MAADLAPFVPEGAVVELRVCKPRPMAGYFTRDSLEEMARQALALEGQAAAVYFTLNPLAPSLHQQSPDRVKPSRTAATDADVTARRWLLIDCDPVRPADTNATDAEKAAAGDVAGRAYAYLESQGWGKPGIADSGNGFHLVYAIDLPNDEEAKNLAQNVLKALAQRFNTDAVKTDTSVYNSSRITKFYGTLTRKGEATQERPHRRSKWVQRVEWVPVAREKLEALVSAAKGEGQNGAPGGAPAALPAFDGDLERLHVRIREDSKKWDPAISGQGGHNTAYRIVNRVLNDWGLSEDEAWPYLLQWNERCQPPWSERELRHKVQDAIKKGPKEGRTRGWLARQESPTSCAGGDGANTSVHNPYAIHSDGYEPYCGDDDGYEPYCGFDPGPDPEPGEPGQQPQGGPDASQEGEEPVLHEAALYGLAGEIVRAMRPYTEASDAALLVQLLVAFGNVVGRNAYWQADGARHHANLFAVLVGRTAKARKGTSWGRVRELLKATPGLDDWPKERVKSNIASGQYLVRLVEDPRFKLVKHENSQTGELERRVEPDPRRPGVEDKRLLIQLEEFANLLKQSNQEGSILSGIIREAWDGKDLSYGSMAQEEMKATGPHISIVGHVTRDDLESHLLTADKANGFGNRFLWTFTNRARKLPHGGSTPPQLPRLAQLLSEKIAAASVGGQMVRDEEANRLWEDLYNGELDEVYPGLVGDLLSRSEAQTLRLSMVYALMEGSHVIYREHLEAALALWRYCVASVKFVFGGRTGNALADKILAELRKRHEMDRENIRALVGCHVKAPLIDEARDVLTGGPSPKVVVVRVSTRGRAREVWRLVSAKKAAA
jgi:hypothetical protein